MLQRYTYRKQASSFVRWIPESGILDKKICSFMFKNFDRYSLKWLCKYSPISLALHHFHADFNAIDLS